LIVRFAIKPLGDVDRHGGGTANQDQADRSEAEQTKQIHINPPMMSLRDSQGRFGLILAAVW
jgi:hypothetical protein